MSTSPDLYPPPHPPYFPPTNTEKAPMQLLLPSSLQAQLTNIDNETILWLFGQRRLFLTYFENIIFLSFSFLESNKQKVEIDMAGKRSGHEEKALKNISGHQ